MTTLNESSDLSESETLSSAASGGGAAWSPEGFADRNMLALTAFERTRMSIIIANPRAPDAPIVLVNRAFLELTGYPGEDVIGRNCRLLQGPETSMLAIAEIRDAIAQERESTVELLNYRRDGSTFWNQLCCSPIHDPAGRVHYWFSSQLDVTHRRREQALLAAEHRLMREIDHRAMNALALVQAIVRLTRADNVAQYATSVQGRVGSVARAHTLLAGNGWEAVPIQKLLLGEIIPHERDRISVQGPDVLLPARAVQPVALVIHEMLANSTAHGALSTTDGRIAITWSRHKDPSRLTLSWLETGGPTPTASPTAGFGATIIDAILKRQLGGVLTRDWRPDGLAAEMTLPRIPALG